MKTLNFWILALLFLSSFGCSPKQKLAKSKFDVDGLMEVIGDYNSKTGSVPSQEQGFHFLVSEGYLKRMPIDPWGNVYEYGVSENSAGQAVVIIKGRVEAKKTFSVR